MGTASDGGSTVVEIEARRVEGVALGGDGAPQCIPAGSEAAGEFVCAGCGYGVSVRAFLPICPMCRGAVWVEPLGAVSGSAPV